MAEAQKLKIEIESIALSTAKSNLGLGADCRKKSSKVRCLLSPADVRFNAEVPNRTRRILSTLGAGPRTRWSDT